MYKKHIFISFFFCNFQVKCVSCRLPLIFLRFWENDIECHKQKKEGLIKEN